MPQNLKFLTFGRSPKYLADYPNINNFIFFYCGLIYYKVWLISDENCRRSSVLKFFAPMLTKTKKRKKRKKENTKEQHIEQKCGAKRWMGDTNKFYFWAWIYAEVADPCRNMSYEQWRMVEDGHTTTITLLTKSNRGKVLQYCLYR